MMSAFTASVVLPFRDEEATIEEQLSALAAQDYDQPWEIIVVDNGSRDESLNIARHWSAQIEDAMVLVEPRPGAAHARNTGVRAARSPLILFCEADDVVSPSWVRRMVEALGHFDLVGGSLEYTRLNAAPALSSRNHNQTSKLCFCLGHLHYSMAANAGVSRRAFDAVGGFDPGFEGGAEDVDFCWRVQNHGFTIGFAPDAIVHYRLRSSITALMRQQYRYSRENQRLYAKHRELGTLATPPILRYKVALRLVIDALARAPSLASRRRRWRYLGRVGKAGGSCAGLLRYRIPLF